jgi:hypothetical protein
MHKGSTQTNKKIKVRVQKKGAKETEENPGLAHRTVRCTTRQCPVHHRTVSGAPRPYDFKLFTFGFLMARSAIIHRTVWCATGLSGAPAEQRLPAQRSTATDTCKVLQCADSSHRVRAATRGAPDSVRCGTGLSGAT